MSWLVRSADARALQLLAEDVRIVTVHGLGGVGTSSLVARTLGGARVTRIDASVVRPAAIERRLRDAHEGDIVWIDQVHRSAVLGSRLASTHARLWISSRAPLGIPHEHRVRVDLLEGPTARTLMIDALARAGVTSPEPAALDALTALVDGWPLAAHAVARWSRVLGVGATLRRGLVGLDGDDARACREVLEGAWAALSGEARSALAALAFARSWIDTSDLGPGEDGSLATLFDHGLLAADAGRVRARTPVAAFVRERCGDRRRGEARSAHVARVLARGERARALHRPDPVAALALLADVQDELLTLAADASPSIAVRATLALEPLFLGRLERDVVLTLLTRATDAASPLGDAERADVALALVRALVMRGDHESAEQVLRETPALGVSAMGTGYRALFLGHIAAWRRAIDQARALLDEASVSARAARGSRGEDLREDLLLQRMFLAHVADDRDEADRLARRIAEHASARPSPRIGAIARSFVAEGWLRDGRASQAARLFERSRDELASFGDHAGALGTSSRRVEALRAAGETTRAEAEASATRAAAARAGEATLELLGLGESGGPSWTRVAELAWRIQIPLVREHAERWLAAHAPDTPPITLRIDRTQRALAIDGRIVSLGRRATLWRVLETLAAAHASTVASSGAALFRAGWPGDRADAASQKKRVQTAVWTLRKLGLDGALRTHAEGYALAPEVRVLWDPVP